jgi:hypothetical protein
MAKEKKLSISRKTIEGICGEFGFGYEPDADGNVFATVGGEKIEIKFKGDGSLPRGRNRFLSAARKNSPEFAAFYPPSKKPKASIGAKRKPLANPLPKLNKAFLMKYSGEALNGLEKLLPEVLDAKAEEKDREERISVLEERNEKLQAVLKAVKAADIPAPTGVEDEVSRNDRDLTNLRSQQG